MYVRGREHHEHTRPALAYAGIAQELADSQVPKCTPQFQPWPCLHTCCQNAARPSRAWALWAASGSLSWTTPCANALLSCSTVVVVVAVAVASDEAEERVAAKTCSTQSLQGAQRPRRHTARGS